MSSGGRASAAGRRPFTSGTTGRDWDADTDLQYNRARWYDPSTGRWLSQDPIGFEAGDANLYRYVGNGATTKTDPSGYVEVPVIHGTTPGAAPSIIGGGIQAGIHGGIWVSTQGGGVSQGATVQLNYTVSPSQVTEIPQPIIKDAGKAANKGLKGSGLTGAERAAAWARAKGEYIANWSKSQKNCGVFKMQAPPPYSGSHYFFTPEGWRTAAPRLTSISGAGSEGAIAALSSGQVADEALDAARQAARAKWGARVRTVGRVGGRVLIVVGVGASAYEIYTADNGAKETAKQVGGWSGALSCAYVGGAGGSLLGPIGTGVGAIGGGVVGFFAGSKAGENYYEFFFEPGMLME